MLRRHCHFNSAALLFYCRRIAMDLYLRVDYVIAYDSYMFRVWVMVILHCRTELPPQSACSSQQARATAVLRLLPGKSRWACRHWETKPGAVVGTTLSGDAGTNGRSAAAKKAWKG